MLPFVFFVDQNKKAPFFDPFSENTHFVRENKFLNDKRKFPTEKSHFIGLINTRANGIIFWVKNHTSP